MSKVLSLVIPTYNMDRYLEKCLSSLIISNELMDKLEVLVINDGSKDRSSEIGHSYETKYPDTFRVIDKENGNYGSCINRGLKEATGKYIKILDADDYYDTKNFESFIKLLNDIDVDGVVSDMKTVDMAGQQINVTQFDFCKNCTSTFEEIMEYPFKKIPMHCITYKTENVRRIGYQQTEGISHTDMEWICKPMTTCNTIYYFPQIVYYYLEGRAGQTMDIDVYKKNFGHDLKVQASMINTLKEFSGIESAQTNYLTQLLASHSEFIYFHFFVIFRMQVCNNEMVESDKYLCKVAPSVAKELENLTRIKPLNYHYVKWWRRLGYPRQLLVMTWGMYLREIKERFLIS